MPARNVPPLPSATFTAEWMPDDNFGTVLRLGPRGSQVGLRLIPIEAIGLARWILDTYQQAIGTDAATH